jgi:hypothetical protein
MIKRNEIVMAPLMTAVVAALLLLTRPAYGQDANKDPIHMAGILANMQNTIDAKKAKPGEVFTLKTANAATLNDGTVVPVGSTFEGHVVSATRSEHHSDSTLVVTIDRLHLKGGKDIAVKAVIVKVSSLLPEAGAVTPSYQDGGTNIGGGGVTTPEPSTAISSTSDDISHPVTGLTVTNSVTGSTSGTFTQKRKNVRLTNEDQLGLGVAVIPAGSILQ